MSEQKTHSELFTTVGVALDEYEYLWKLHASGIDIYERTHRLAVDALADLEEQLEALEARLRDIEGRCQRCDSSIGIEQARELGRENFCTVCWDTPIIRRYASSPAISPKEDA